MKLLAAFTLHQMRRWSICVLVKTRETSTQNEKRQQTNESLSLTTVFGWPLLISLLFYYKLKSWSFLANLHILVKVPRYHQGHSYLDNSTKLVAKTIFRGQDSRISCPPNFLFIWNMPTFFGKVSTLLPLENTQISYLIKLKSDLQSGLPSLNLPKKNWILLKSWTNSTIPLLVLMSSL